MDNPELGRQVLDQIDSEPASFNMATWGLSWDDVPGVHKRAYAAAPSCGIVACLGGHTLLQAGYLLDTDTNDYYRPDGSRVENDELAWEAEKLLDMTSNDVRFGALPYGRQEIWFDMGHGLERFRALVEQAEAAADGR